jgi:hypothetical protein
VTYYVSLTKRTYPTDPNERPLRGRQACTTLLPGDLLKVLNDYAPFNDKLHLMVADGPRAGHQHVFRKGSKRLRLATPLEILARQALDGSYAEEEQTPPRTRTPCSVHKGFIEDCGCPPTDQVNDD